MKISKIKSINSWFKITTLNLVQYQVVRNLHLPFKISLKKKNLA